MKDLRTEVSKLRSLIEVEVAHWLCSFHETWVIVVHTINICPDLNLVSTDSRTYDACAVVTASTLEIVDLTVGIAADEALCHVDLGIWIGRNLLLEILLDILEVWFSVLVDSHVLECRDESHIDTLLKEIEIHEVGAHQLTLSHDATLLKDCESTIAKRTDIVKDLTDHFTSLLLVAILNI